MGWCIAQIVLIPLTMRLQPTAVPYQANQINRRTAEPPVLGCSVATGRYK